MKNKVYYILLSLLVSFSFINNVFAEGITISAVVDSAEVVKGEKTSVMIKLTADEAILQCRFKLESDDTIVYDSVSSVNSWNPSGTGVDGILVEGSLTSTEIPNGLGILKVNYTVNGSGKVTIKTEQCTTTVDDQAVYPADVTVNFTAIDPADDTTLSSLTITGAQPIVFDPNRSDYAVTLTSPNFSLSMTASNSDYQDDIVVKDANGTTYDPNNITFKDLSDGQNMMILYITVNGKQMYTLATSYEQKDLDNSLSSIKINGTTLTLEEGKLDYEFEVGSDVNSVLVEAVLKDSENFQIGKDSNILSGRFNIVDTVDAVIVVEPKSAELGAESKTYTVTIKKKGSTGSTNPDKEPDDEPSGGTTKPSGSDGDVTSNPGTGDISMFIMAFILIASLVGSVILYQKNLESYK